jgi:thiol-disulfide isomerase/thioredoxin
MMKLVTGLVAAVLMVGSASAATVADFTPQAFAAAQKSGAPILVFVEASWCPTCAKQRPILSELYKEPEFDALKVYQVDFDSQKDIVKEFGVRMQSTLIAFHGGQEEARATGITDPAAIKDLVAKANG